MLQNWGGLMGETIQQMRKQLNEYWESLDKDKKRRITVSGILVLVGIIILITFISKPRYEVLYENLTLKDTAEVTKKLDEMNVKWKTGDSETTILVPKDQKNKVKLELASYGLPKEGYGFVDAFDDSSWTMTDYEKKERLKFALQNELASTISEIDGIESAKVYIEEQEETGFVLDEDESETTASVFIEKSGNKKIPVDTVTAIRNLVAGSINMDPDKVSVIDDTGKLLTENGEEGTFDISDRYIIKQNLEAKIDDSIKKFLENVFGYGNVDIRSSVKINFDNEKTTSVEFAPPIEGSDEGLIRSMEEIEESMVSGDVGEVPGQDANPPEDQVMLEDEAGRHDKASNVINYELNEINNEIRKTPGDIEAVTVAVLINRDAIIDGELTEERKNEIEELIYAATGLDTEQVYVSSERFSALETDEEADEKTGILKWILIGLTITAGVIGFIIYRRREEDLPEEIDVDLEDTMEETNIEELDFDAENSKMKEQIESSIEKNPDAIAKLLRTWLNE